MKTLKKTLCLVLAVVMVVGVLILPASATGYRDDDKITHKEAAEVLTGLKIMEGDEDGFSPAKPLTRAMAAAIITRLLETREFADSLAVDATLIFPDCDAANIAWAKKYIAYCQLKNIIIGDDQGLFNPTKNVKAVDYAKMLLCAMGYDPVEHGYYGDGYRLAVQLDARKYGLTDGLAANFDFSAEITRDDAAQMTLNAMFAERASGSQLKKDPTTGNYEVVPVPVQGTIANDVYGLTKNENYHDQWGAPSVMYESKKLGLTFSVPYPLVDSFSGAKDECDIFDDGDLKKDGPVESYYVNGVEQDLNDKNVGVFKNRAGKLDNNIKALNVGYTTGADGVATFVYAVTNDYGVVHYEVVQKEIWLAKVTAVLKPTEDKNHHKGEDTITFEVYVGTDGKDVANCGFTDVKTNENQNAVVIDTQVDNGEYQRGEYLLVNYCDGEWVIVGRAPQTEAKTESKHFHFKETGDQYITFGDGLDEKGNNTGEDGNVIGRVKKALPDDYVVVEAIAWIHSTLKGGKAYADLWVLEDGELKEKQESVEISKINGADAKNSDKVVNTYDDLKDDDGKVAFGGVADNYKNNKYYYNHIWNLTGSADGKYSFTTESHVNKVGETSTKGLTPDNDDSNRLVDSNGFAKIEKGVANIMEVTGNKFFARGTDDTYYLITNGDGTYKDYKGVNNVPDTTGKMCAAYDANGFAVLVVVYELEQSSGGTTDTEKPTDASYYVADPEADDGTVTVYPEGKIEASSLNNLPNGLDQGTGLYLINRYESNGKYNSTTSFVADYQPSEKLAEYKDHNAMNLVATAPVTGNTLYTKTWTGKLGAVEPINPQFNDDDLNFRVNDDTKYIVVTKEGPDKNDKAVLTEGAVNDIQKGSVVIVVFNAKKLASCVYIIDLAGEVKPETSNAPIRARNEYKAVYSALGIKVTEEENKVTFTWSASEMNKKLMDSTLNNFFARLAHPIGTKTYLFLGVHINGENADGTYDMTLNGEKTGTDTAEDCGAKGADLYFAFTDGSEYSGTGAYGVASKTAGTYTYTATKDKVTYTIVLEVTD